MGNLSMGVIAVIIYKSQMWLSGKKINKTWHFIILKHVTQEYNMAIKSANQQ